MSLARSCGVVINGIDGLIVEIEAYLAQGLPGMTIVGLGDTAVGESRDRVRAAIQNSGLTWPAERRITIGLSPASVRKNGASLDLGIALAILTAQGAVDTDVEYAAVGELALDGRVSPIRGVLVAAAAALKANITTLLVPHSQVSEAQLVDGLTVIGVSSLHDALAFLRGQEWEVPHTATVTRIEPPAPDMADVRGQHAARLGLEIAAAGGHHIAFLGSPGVGKTMLAQRLPGLLPKLDAQTAVEVTSIHSAAGLLPMGSGLIRIPPFQAPHHTASSAAMIGGGSGHVRIGMVTLAHAGVLCLDEAAEFDRGVLDALRQPLESGTVTVSRAGFTAQLPARFQMVLASNPCPCGKFQGDGSDCTCTPHVRRRYFARLSGPLLDRIDIRVSLERPTLAELDPTLGDAEPTAPIAQRIQAARERAAHRYRELPWSLNAHIPGPTLRKHFRLHPNAQAVLINGGSHLSARAYDRVLRLAWTIADLQEHSEPTPSDVATALSFRDAQGAWLAAA